jgi:hypothetical protein
MYGSSHGPYGSRQLCQHHHLHVSLILVLMKSSESQHSGVHVNMGLEFQAKHDGLWFRKVT